MVEVVVTAVVAVAAAFTAVVGADFTVAAVLAGARMAVDSPVAITAEATAATLMAALAVHTVMAAAPTAAHVADTATDAAMQALTGPGARTGACARVRVAIIPGHRKVMESETRLPAGTPSNAQAAVEVESAVDPPRACLLDPRARLPIPPSLTETGTVSAAFVARV